MVLSGPFLQFSAFERTWHFLKVLLSTTRFSSPRRGPPLHDEENAVLPPSQWGQSIFCGGQTPQKIDFPTRLRVVDSFHVSPHTWEWSTPSNQFSWRKINHTRRFHLSNQFSFKTDSNEKLNCEATRKVMYSNINHRLFSSRLQWTKLPIKSKRQKNDYTRAPYTHVKELIIEKMQKKYKEEGKKW